MTANIQQVIEKAKDLNAHDRALVAHCLISSLEIKQENGVERAWAELAEKRYNEIESGQVKPVSWGEIKNEIKG